jgi:hypothetical protein
MHEREPWFPFINDPWVPFHKEKSRGSTEPRRETDYLENA